jgi:hypothetical protein
MGVVARWRANEVHAFLLTKHRNNGNDVITVHKSMKKGYCTKSLTKISDTPSPQLVR